MTVFLRLCSAVVALIVVQCLWSPSSAQAQTFACSGAAGERMVGHAPGPNGQGGVPLCMSDGSGGGGYAAPTRPPVLTYGAFAAHIDATDIWSEGNQRQAGVAERTALEACNRAMGGGCESGEWNDSSMAIIRDQTGVFFHAWLGEGDAERRRVMDLCSSRQELPCQVFKTINANGRRHRPGPEARRSYAVGAWVQGTIADGYDRKLYLASGYRSMEEARPLAIAACLAANPGRNCQIAVEAGGTFIQTVTNDRGRDFTVVETSVERARSAGEIRCRRDGGTGCEVQATFDTRQRGLFVHDFSRGAAG